jgi:hypothetical protein
MPHSSFPDDFDDGTIHPSSLSQIPEIKVVYLMPGHMLVVVPIESRDPEFDVPDKEVEDPDIEPDIDDDDDD